MPSVPVPADPGWDDDLAWLDRDPMTPAELEAQLDRLCELDEPDHQGEDEYWDHDDLTAEELAEIRAAAADELLAVAAASTGRRGPGQPGSARVFPGESASTAAGFGTGMPLDVTPGCPELAVAADAAVGGGDEDCFDGVADHELIGLLCAWDRLEAHMAARKLAVAAELFRRNPEDGFEPSPGAMPEVVSEFAADQLACALAESRNHADGMLTMAWHLATRLTGTMAALRDGVITRFKAEIIVRATVTLEPEEAKKAEAKVLDRAGRLTPGSLRAAIARAVMEVAPKKARKRREEARKDARVERWQEDSGNAALAGFELPPDEALAADQRITWWARELKKAGLEGDMDVLRARAFLDLILGKDSRPTADADGGAGAGGFAGRATLTVPLVTLLDLADAAAAQPQDHVVRDGHGPARPRRRARLRAARTRWSQDTGRTGPAGVHLHPYQPGRAARRVRHLAVAHPWARPGPDRYPRLHPHRPVRASVRSQRT